MRDRIHICEGAEALASHAATWLVDLMVHHFETSDAPFSLALSGGSTPKRLYQRLGELPAGRVDWSRVVLLWGDERNVPADHADSNFRMVQENLLDHIDIPASNVWAVPNPGGPADEAAAKYQDWLLERLPRADNSMPQIDCVLLGMGDDVHTASLFPGSRALAEQSRAVVENRVEKLDTWRVTLTAPAINAARHVAFLIAGAGKQPALDSLWHGALDPEKYPSQLIRPQAGQLWFLLDRAAIGSLETPAPATVEVIAPS